MKLEERFWSKVETGGIAPGMDTPCWIWTASLDAHGYGQFSVGGRADHRVCKAQRVAYELEHGVRLSTDQKCLHRCDLPVCVRPSHLFIGTMADNSADMVAKGRSNFGVRNPNAKITMADAVAIREAIAAGLNRRSVAERYGISQSNITYIVSGKTWKVA